MPKVHYLNTIRTFDKDGFKKRAGCLCFKSEAENEVCSVVENNTSCKFNTKYFIKYQSNIVYYLNLYNIERLWGNPNEFN